MRTIFFPNSVLYTGNRPYADVVIKSKKRKTSTFKCLVDTGADYLQLPISAAKQASISLTAATPKDVTTVAGSTTLLFVTGVNVEIEGCPVTVDILFDQTNSTSPLAGRQLLLAAFELGFDVRQWLWN
jgi:predicted aspartyl protease